jgi:predicted RNA binding protein YcfA (HicA-like mRNA interferase family)
MKRTELERKLRKGGWGIEHGGKHNITYHPDNPKRKTTVPRGSNIDELTAKGILRFAGLL